MQIFQADLIMKVANGRIFKVHISLVYAEFGLMHLHLRTKQNECFVKHAFYHGA